MTHPIPVCEPFAEVSIALANASISPRFNAWHGGSLMAPNLAPGRQLVTGIEIRFPP